MKVHELSVLYYAQLQPSMQQSTGRIIRTQSDYKMYQVNPSHKFTFAGVFYVAEKNPTGLRAQKKHLTSAERYH